VNGRLQDVLLVGPTGCGKTTVIRRVLERLSHPSHLCGEAVEHQDRPRSSILDGDSARRLEDREPFR
jgi:hypothetical protein